MSTFKELIRQVKSEIREVSVDEARKLSATGAVLVDVREADEWSQGHVPGAVFIPRGFLEQRIEETFPDKSKEVVVYCAGGTRSAFGARTLIRLALLRLHTSRRFLLRLFLLRAFTRAFVLGGT